MIQENQTCVPDDDNDNDDDDDDDDDDGDGDDDYDDEEETFLERSTRDFDRRSVRMYQHHTNKIHFCAWFLYVYTYLGGTYMSIIYTIFFTTAM